MSTRDRIAASVVAVALALARFLPGPGGTHIQAETLRQRSRYDRGQSGVISLFLGITVAVIVGVGVVIPLMNDQMDAVNFTSPMTETVVGYIPLFIGLLLLVGVAAPMMRSL